MKSVGVGFVSLLVVLAGVGLIWYGIGSGAAPASAPEALGPSTEVVFSVLVSGERSSVTMRKNYIIRSNLELRELWKVIETSKQVPDIDFKTTDVVAVFAGQEPSGGYAIEIEKVADSTRRQISVRITAPGGSCIVSEAFTRPYEIILLPKTSLPLAHDDRVTTISCLD